MDFTGVEVYNVLLGWGLIGLVATSITATAAHMIWYYVRGSQVQERFDRVERMATLAFNGQEAAVHEAQEYRRAREALELQSREAVRALDKCHENLSERDEIIYARNKTIEQLWGAIRRHEIDTKLDFNLPSELKTEGELDAHD